MAGCVLLTVGGVAPQVLAAQEESGPTEDTQLASTKLALASALAQAGVISRHRQKNHAPALSKPNISGVHLGSNPLRKYINIWSVAV